jgi:YfiR/HmsC-like
LAVFAQHLLRYDRLREIMRTHARLAVLALVAVAPLAAPGRAMGDPGGDTGPHAAAVVRTVRSLVEYTRWPRVSNPVELCVAGPASHAGQLDAVRLGDGRVLNRRAVAASPAALAGCDVVYIGKLPLAGQRQLTAAVRGRGVMTVAEADPECRSEAMFCLIYPVKGLSFRLNIDAVSRSGLRVDPRVLRVSQGGL